MSTPLFIRTVSLRVRLTLALVLAFLLIFADHRLGAMQQVRMFLNSAISPVQYLAVLPEQSLDNFIYSIQSRRSLIAENDRLKHEMLELQGQLQRFEFLALENDRLRLQVGGLTHVVGAWWSVPRRLSGGAYYRHYS